LPLPLPFVINTFSCVSSAFSSWRLQNHAIFHVFSSTAGHISSRWLLGPHETSCWVRQARSGVVCFLIFSFFFVFADFLFCSQVTRLHPPCQQTWPPSPLRAHQAPLPTMMTMMMHGNSDMPTPCLVSAPACTTSPCSHLLHEPPLFTTQLINVPRTLSSTPTLFPSCSPSFRKWFYVWHACNCVAGPLSLHVPCHPTPRGTCTASVCLC
jgi:hypothetical protein